MRWLKYSGKVANDFYILGSSDTPVYLVRYGDTWTLIEGGMAKHKQIVLLQLKYVVGDLTKVKHWIITHSHYDHCGLLEFLVPHFPCVNVYASAKAIEYFAKEKYRKTIYKYNEVEEAVKPEKDTAPTKNRIALDQIPMIAIAEGDKIRVSDGDELDVISTPGHSDCLVSIYDAAKERLFVSDALGEILSNQNWFPLAFQSMNEYIQSLIKISQIPVDTIALGHYGIISGTQAKGAAINSLNSSYKMIEQIEGYVKKYTHANAVANQLSKDYSAPSKSFVPEKVHQASMNQLVNILKEEAFIL